MIDSEKLRLDLVEHICARRCMGVAGKSAGCCAIGDRDFIIGPIRDADAFRARLEEKLRRAVPHAEIFVDHEEGSAMFPERPTWQSPAHYPALRVGDAPLRPCRLHGGAEVGCTVHAIRPDTCRDFVCDPLARLLGSI